MFQWLGDLCDLVSLAWHFKSLLWYRAAYFKEENAEAFCKLLQDRGAFFIKLGQWLAQRTDSGLPDLYCKKLKELQTDAPRHSWEETVQVCHPYDLSEIEFEDIDAGVPVPIKSGSIAQVYRVKCSVNQILAMRKEGDDELSTFTYTPDSVKNDEPIRFALKVCHPNVGAVFARSLRTVTNLYLLAQWYFGKQSFLAMVNIHDVVAQEFQRQCNLICEANQCLKIRDNLRNNPFASAPFPCFATPNFFFIEYVKDAIFYDEIGALDKQNYANQQEIDDTKMVAKQITLAAFFQMVLYDGCSHGDCHSGNILYRITPKDRVQYETELLEMKNHAVVGRPLRIAPVHICVYFIDFGIVVDIDDNLRNTMLDLTVSINSCDSRLMAKAFEKVLVDREKMSEPKMQAFRDDCELANERLREKDKIGPGTTLQDQVTTVLDTFRKHRLCLEASALRVIISWMLIDENTPVIGREDNLPDNTIRWIATDDVDDRFHLHQITSIIIGAREARIINEKERDQGKEVAFCAPDLAKLREKHQRKRETAMNILDVLTAEETTLGTNAQPKGDKKKRIKIV